jgi:hypothetical protein
VSLQGFMEILRELESEGLFETFGDNYENLLIARSQAHPSVPYGNAMEQSLPTEPGGT